MTKRRSWPPRKPKPKKRTPNPMNDQEHPISLDMVLSESNAPLAVDPRRQELVDTLNPLVPKIAEYQAQVDAMQVRTQTDADNAAALLSAISRDSKEVVGAIKDVKTE